MIRELEGLRDEVDTRRRSVEDGWSRAAGLIQGRLDGEVQRVFRRIRDDLPESLAKVDRAVDGVVTSYLEAHGIPHTRTEEHGRVQIKTGGTSLVIGSTKGMTGVEPLHLGHPLVAAAIEDARIPGFASSAVRIDVARASPGLQALRTHRGRLVVARIGYAGFEPVDHLVTFAATREEVLEPSLARELLELPMQATAWSGDVVPDDRIDDLLDESVFLDQEEVEAAERLRFDEARARLERSVEDRVLILRRRHSDIERKKAKAIADRDKALSVDARQSAERALKKCDAEGSELEMALLDLEQRTEEAYGRRRDALTRRRAPAPLVERIIDVGFELA